LRGLEGGVPTGAVVIEMQLILLGLRRVGVAARLSIDEITC
jgi:hypothetical protein